MKTYSPFCLLLFLVGFISCESEEFLPLETHEGNNTFGFISPDMVKRGGNIDANDSVYYDQGTGQFTFKFKTKSTGSLNKYGTWRFLNLHLTFNDYLSYQEYILDSAIYFERNYYSDAQSLYIDKSQDGVYYLDTSQNVSFWVFQHKPLDQQISGSFDFHMYPKRVYGDTSFLDTTKSIQLIAGRYDAIYSLE